MSSLYPRIIEKIKKNIRDLNFILITEPPEVLKEKKKRFYRALLKNEKGETFFYKSLLKKEKGIKTRFLKEIKFLKTLKENPNHPLAFLVPKLVSFSLSSSFPYLLYLYLLGTTKKREEKLSSEEIKKIAEILKIINSCSPSLFKFLNRPSNYQKRIKTLLDPSLPFLKREKEKIERLVEKNKKLIQNIKIGLSHGDFSEANLLFQGKEIKVLDWEHVGLRSHLYDLADFWLKRKNYPQEQNLLLKEYQKKAEFREKFSEVFKLNLLEIVLRDLNLFQEIVRKLKREKGNSWQKKKEIFEKEIKENLKIVREKIL